jgi:subtilase family serine protease
MSDIDAFRTAAGLPKYDPTLLLVPSTGASQHSTGDETEADLDIEWSGAVAKNAGIIYVYVGNSTTKTVFDALKYAITNNVAPIISISYGNCEAALGSSVVMTMQQWAQQANSQGQTISGPSGDDGAADCESSTATVATHGLAVDVPAAIPEVTGVGGSEFSGDAAATVSGGCASATTFWTGSCSATSGASAISYIPEMGWNDTNSNGLAASGGGASTIFSKPPWQTGTGVPSDGKRDVPDVAFDGANGHDPYLICSQDFFTGGSNATSCSNGFRASDQSLAAIGGTSAGAPTFAGVLAILNQATRSNGLGNVNPDLYNLSGTSAFHDITSGNNKVPCTTGTPNCPSGTLSIGFNAGTGYDQATGLGSMDVANLEAAWPGLVINQDYVVAASPSLITVSSPGQNVSSTVLAGSLNGFSGTVALSCLVSSTTSGVGCSLSSPSISIDSSTTNQRVAVSLTTTAASVNARRLGATFWACSLLLPGILLCSAQADSFKRTLRVLAVGLLALAVGCGGGSSSSQKQQSQGTPAGTYTVTVTGTSGALSHSATVSLTVQ